VSYQSDLDILSHTLVSGIVDDGVKVPRSMLKALDRGLKRAFELGQKSGRFGMLLGIRDAMGVGALTAWTEEEVLGMLRHLRDGGRVTINIHDGQKPKKSAPKLRLIRGGE